MRMTQSEHRLVMQEREEEPWSDVLGNVMAQEMSNDPSKDPLNIMPRTFAGTAEGVCVLPMRFARLLGDKAGSAYCHLCCLVGRAFQRRTGK